MKIPLSREVCSVVALELRTNPQEVFVLADCLTVDLFYAANDVALHLEVKLVRFFLLLVLTIGFQNTVEANSEFALTEQLPRRENSLPLVLSGFHGIIVFLDEIHLRRQSVLRQLSFPFVLLIVNFLQQLKPVLCHLDLILGLLVVSPEFSQSVLHQLLLLFQLPRGCGLVRALLHESIVLACERADLREDRIP